jgi:hypothetical protein
MMEKKIRMKDANHHHSSNKKEECFIWNIVLKRIQWER